MTLIATLRSPLVVYLPRVRTKDRAFVLNLNPYRNTHHQILNPAKVVYKQCMRKQIEQLPMLDKVAVRYTLFPRTAQLSDISNICCIHDKFFMDALVEFGRLIDDNYMFYAESCYKFGAKDKDNPRVDIEIFAV